jgi:hypothetical protein
LEGSLLLCSVHLIIVKGVLWKASKQLVQFRTIFVASA